MKKCLFALLLIGLLTSTSLANSHMSLKRVMVSILFENEWDHEQVKLIAAFGKLDEAGVIEESEKRFLASLQAQEPTTSSTGSVLPTTGTSSCFDFEVTIPHTSATP